MYRSQYLVLTFVRHAWCVWQCLEQLLGRKIFSETQTEFWKDLCCRMGQWTFGNGHEHGAKSMGSSEHGALGIAPYFSPLSKITSNIYFSGKFFVKIGVLGSKPTSTSFYIYLTHLISAWLLIYKVQKSRPNLISAHFPSWIWCYKIHSSFPLSVFNHICLYYTLFFITIVGLHFCFHNNIQKTPLVFTPIVPDNSYDLSTHCDESYI